jgi:hypothetical protein
VGDVDAVLTPGECRRIANAESRTTTEIDEARLNRQSVEQHAVLGILGHELNGSSGDAGAERTDGGGVGVVPANLTALKLQQLRAIARARSQVPELADGVRIELETVNGAHMWVVMPAAWLIRGTFWTLARRFNLKSPLFECCCNNWLTSIARGTGCHGKIGCVSTGW